MQRQSRDGGKGDGMKYFLKIVGLHLFGVLIFVGLFVYAVLVFAPTFILLHCGHHIFAICVLPFSWVFWTAVAEVLPTPKFLSKETKEE